MNDYVLLNYFNGAWIQSIDIQVAYVLEELNSLVAFTKLKLNNTNIKGTIIHAKDGYLMTLSLFKTLLRIKSI